MSASEPTPNFSRLLDLPLAMVERFEARARACPDSEGKKLALLLCEVLRWTAREDEPAPRGRRRESSLPPVHALEGLEQIRQHLAAGGLGAWVSVEPDHVMVAGFGGGRCAEVTVIERERWSASQLAARVGEAVVHNARRPDDPRDSELGLEAPTHRPVATVLRWSDRCLLCGGEPTHILLGYGEGRPIHDSEDFRMSVVCDACTPKGAGLIGATLVAAGVATRGRADDEAAE